MAQSYFGSIDYDKLLENLKQGKLKTYKSDKGKRYININVYIKDEPDQYGNNASISVPLKDEHKIEKEKRLYIGNLKKSEPRTQEASAQSFIDDEEDLPF